MASWKGDDQLVIEQRRMFDRQVRTLERIDDLTARLVRITALVIGFVVTGVGALTQSATRIYPTSALLGGTGLLFLVAAVITGMDAFGQTEYKTRFTTDEYAGLQAGTHADREHQVIAAQYRQWSSDVQTAITRQSVSFAKVQGALFLGVMFLAVGGVLLTTPPEVVRRVDQFDPAIALSARLLAVCLVFLVFVGGLGVILRGLNRLYVRTEG